MSYLFACSLADVEKRTQDANINGDESAWRPYFTFVEHLREKHEKNEVLHGVLNSLSLLTVPSLLLYIVADLLFQFQRRKKNL